MKEVNTETCVPCEQNYFLDKLMKIFLNLQDTVFIIITSKQKNL